MSLKQSIIDLCVNIYAHLELDMEVTIEGNGVNCSEAAATADGFLKLVGLTSEDIEKKIAKKVEEIKKEYGLE